MPKLYADWVGDKLFIITQCRRCGADVIAGKVKLCKVCRRKG